LLEHPGVGIFLGLAVAFALFRFSRSSFEYMTPESSVNGLLFVSVSLFARLGLATVLLWAYKYFVPHGLAPFALSLAGGFLVLYTVELVRYAGLHRYTRSTGRP